tara:strand:+ start:2137 stop:3408 length:1272 start_codon:yes stop_codon:yes gene_type:complete
MDKLAIFGGSKIIKNKFKKFNSIGEEEASIVSQVLKKGTLSNFIAKHGDNFLGGEFVNKFERNWEEKFDVKHAVSVNSWTSGLICAVGSLDIEPGDEIILPPWTMSACAMSILNWNAIPVFADIDPKTFCINPNSIEKKISKKTKAIMAVDIGGQSCEMDEIIKIAKKYNLKVISDSAQSPGAKYKNKYAGTIADVGGFSLNCHKHIQTGEGGVIVTNDDYIAQKLRLIRNHAESVVGDAKIKNLSNMLGYNFRMGELESAIGIEQLKKLDQITSRRQEIAIKLHEGLDGLEGLVLPSIGYNNTHVYYMFFMKLEITKLKGAKRENILKALNGEGLEGLGIKFSNLHLLPTFQERIVYGKNHFPWTINKSNITYDKGICPVSENLEDETYLGYQMCMHEMRDNEIDLFISAFKKVWKNLEYLN